jgi:hypothetical protein
MDSDAASPLGHGPSCSCTIRYLATTVLLTSPTDLRWLRGGVQCYEELLSKFSGSASLHLDFAHFCEAVLNDEARARKYRHGAEILETGALVRPAAATVAAPAMLLHSSRSGCSRAACMLWRQYQVTLQATVTAGPVRRRGRG